MRKITTKKLLNYSAMSAAILAGANASGQIVFTDIDDTNVLDAGGQLDIDLNNDGIIDYSPAAGPTAAVVLTDSAGINAFIGFDAGGYYYASNLNEGDVIDGSLSTTTAGGRADLNFNGCGYTNSQFCDGVVDGYVGLSFQLDGNTHYGWIRVDVAADGSGFIVKSYAYEATPDMSIMAGETLSLEDNTIEGFSSFVSDNILTLNSNTPLETVTIHSISGQEVISQKLSNTTETVDLNGLSTGVYIATVSVEGKLQAIKFIK